MGCFNCCIRFKRQNNITNLLSLSSGFNNYQQLILFICVAFSNLKEVLLNHKNVYVKRFISDSNCQTFKLQQIIKKKTEVVAIVKVVSPSLCFVPQPKVINRVHKELKTHRCGLRAGHKLHSLSSVITTFLSVMRSTKFLTSNSFRKASILLFLITCPVSQFCSIALS